jgi:hypothetical protein
LTDVRLTIDIVCGFIYNHTCIYKSRDDVAGFNQKGKWYDLVLTKGKPL